MNVSPFAILLFAAGGPPLVNPEAYVIGPEDVLTVHVWKQPEISRRLRVRPDGRISLPLIQDHPAAGLTPARLAAALTEAYRVHLKDPEVAVAVEEVHSKKIYVMGEVVRPGSYPLLSPATILQALTAAGGFREFADTRNILLLRGDKRYRFDYHAVVKGRKLEQNVPLEPGDTILVP